MNRIFAMDTHFMMEKEPLSLAEQVLLVRQAGFDDFYYTEGMAKPEALDSSIAASTSEGLGFAAAYAVVNDVTSSPDPRTLASIERILSVLPRGARLEMGLMVGGFNKDCGDPAHDAAGLRWIEALVPLLDRHDHELSLYPHFGFWMESFTDALRLARAADHPRVKLTFCGYHFFRVGKESSAVDLLVEAGDLLNAANFCGTRLLDDPTGAPHNDFNPTCEPLDSGEMDNASILRWIRDHRPDLSVGVQGYAVNTDPAEALRRSAAHLRSWLKAESDTP